MNKRTLITSLLAAALVPALHAADAKPKYTIKEVMEALHKGEENIAKKVMRGEGTPDDFTKMVEYYASLPLCTPPKGDKAGWNAKALSLLNSAKALKNGAPAGLAAYKQSVNCKNCHTAHKPDKQR